MTLHADVNLAVEVLDEAVEDDEAILIAWLSPLLPVGRVADSRLPDDPLPAIVVTHLEGTESIEESYVSDLISVHALHERGHGNAGRLAAAQFADHVHRRILLLGRYLDEVTINGRKVDYDSLEVTMRPRWEKYADEGILRKVSRYRLGRTYATLS